MHRSFIIKLVAGVVSYDRGNNTPLLVHNLSDIIPYDVDNEFIINHRYIMVVYDHFTSLTDINMYCDNEEDRALIKQTGHYWMIYYKRNIPVIVKKFEDWLKMYERKKNEF